MKRIILGLLLILAAGALWWAGDVIEAPTGMGPTAVVFFVLAGLPTAVLVLAAGRGRVPSPSSRPVRSYAPARSPAVEPSEDVLTAAPAQEITVNGEPLYDSSKPKPEPVDETPAWLRRFENLEFNK